MRHREVVPVNVQEGERVHLCMRGVQLSAELMHRCLQEFRAHRVAMCLSRCRLLSISSQSQKEYLQ